MAVKPILGYWPIRGLGQPIRFLLQYLGVQYEDKYYTWKSQSAVPKEEWFEDRPKLNLHFPNLPYWIDGETKVSESRAIMRHICRQQRRSMLGATDKAQLKIDMVENFIWDFWYMIFIEMLYLHTDELVLKYNEQCPIKLAHLSRFIGSGHWATGETITYVDFWIYEMLHQLKTFDPKVLDNYSNLQRLMTNFEQLQAISNFMKSPRYIATPICAESSIVKI